MYYGLVTVSVILFGIQFFFSDRYQQSQGTSLNASFMLSFLSALVSVVFMAAIHSFRIGFTPFTMMMASIAALNGILCTLCSINALKRCNLSVYSLFSMLGGMLLPVLLSVFFYDEPFTWGKAACLVFVGGAMLLSLQGGSAKGGYGYCIAVFFLNGISACLPKIFADAPFAKADNASYTVLLQASVLVFSGIGLLVTMKKRKKLNWKAAIFAGGGGLLNCIANFILLIALAVLPVSVQYPFLTGGVIIVSTLIAAFTSKKPTKRDVLAVVLSFIGMLLLVLLPM